VQQVARDPVGLTETLVGRQDLGAGQVRTRLVGDQFRGVCPAGPYVDRLAHRRDEIGERSQ
jgi:hypothetical protein